MSNKNDLNQTHKFISSLHKIPLMGWVLILISLTGSLLIITQSTIEPSWQIIVYLSSFAVSICLLMGVVAFLINEKKRTAANIFLIEIILRGFVTSFIYLDSGFAMQFLILSMSAIVIIDWLQKDSISRLMPLIIIFSLLVLATEFIEMSWHIAGPLQGESKFWVAGAYVFLFLLYILFNINRVSVQLKLIFISLSLAAVSVIGIALIYNAIIQQTIRKDALLVLDSSADNLANSIDQFIHEKSLIISSLAANPTLIKFLSIETANRMESNLQPLVTQLMQNWLLQNPNEVVAYAVFDSNGLNIANTNSEDVRKFTLDLNILLPLETGQVNFSLGSISRSAADLNMFFSAPVRHQDGRIIGILSVEYKPGILHSFISKTNDLGGENSFGILINNDNEIVGHGVDQSYIGVSIDKWLETNQELETAIAENTQTIQAETQAISSRPFDAAASIVPLQTTGWEVIYFQPLMNIQSAIGAQTNLSILIAEITALMIIAVGIIIAARFSHPLLELNQVTQEFSNGNFRVRSKIASADEFGELAATYNRIADQLGTLLNEMEMRVRERTIAIETATQVGHVIADIMDPETLVMRAVEELQQAFGYYHVHIYIADHLKHRLVMVGGSGEVGEMLLRQGHNIPFGRGIVGRTALEKQTNLIPETHQDPRWLPNPLLPDTASELAVPILLDEHLLGILDVQRNQPNSLTQQDADTLELIAGQIGVALQNARQYREMESKAEQQSKINECVERIRNTKSIEEALTVAFTEISKLTGSQNIATTLKVSPTKKGQAF